MAKNHFVRLLFSEQNLDSIFEVRQQEEARIKAFLDSDNYGLSVDRFLWFETVDGKSIIVNLRFLQAIRYIWESAEAPSDLLHCEGMIEIYFRGREKPLREYTERPDILHDFFTDLEQGKDVVAFPVFEDADGELIQLNPSEIVRIEAPSHLLDEGLEIIKKDSEVDANA
jgi:hypothetical protein